QLGQRLVHVAGQAGLEGEAVVQVGRRAVGGAIGGRGTGGGEREQKGQQDVVTPKRMILTRAARTSQRRRGRAPFAPPAVDTAASAAREARYSPRIQSFTRFTSADRPSAERR